MGTCMLARLFIDVNAYHVFFPSVGHVLDMSWRDLGMVSGMCIFFTDATITCLILCSSFAGAMLCCSSSKAMLYSSGAGRHTASL